MTEHALIARGLGKVYHIGAHEERYKTFREMLSSLIIAPARKVKELARARRLAASRKRAIRAMLSFG